MILLLFAALLAQDLPRVIIETDLGVMEAEIEVNRAPITAANFLKYVDAKLYDGPERKTEARSHLRTC